MAVAVAKGKAAVREEMADSGKSGSPTERFSVDFVVRLVALATSVAGVIVMVTSNETKSIRVPLLPYPVTVSAKYNYSPAFVYFVVANSAAALYNVIVITGTNILGPKTHPSPITHFRLLVLDSVMTGVTGSGMGASFAVAYIGLKGNSHVQWDKVCNVYGKFCRHVGTSSGISLITTICFILLTMLSARALYRRTQ